MNNQPILVVKLGGGEGLNLSTACHDLAQIARERRLVVIHGVSAALNRLCDEMGVEVKTLTSPTGHVSRYTDPQTRQLFVEAARQVNREIVELLWSYNINAVGLAEDRVLIRGERKTAVRAVIDGRIRIIRDDYTGSIISVDGARLHEILHMGYIPVLPPLAASDDGLLNIDGDRAGAAAAGALQADELVILSNVRGLYRSYPDENSLISQVNQQEIVSALSWAHGRMKRKVIGAQEALAQGVQRVIIGDGRQPQPISAALAGTGTVFTA